MRVTVLLNAGAGTAARWSAVEEAALTDALRGAGLQVDLRRVPCARLAEEARAAAARSDAVLAAGGDGTLGTVAAALAGGPVPLGVLPLGTRNHFARDLGISGLAEAVEVVRRAEVRALDVGEVNGRVFINNASVGVYPEIVEERERRRAGSGRGKGLLSVFAALQVLRRFRPLRVRVAVEGRARVWLTPFVFVGNNEYALRAGGLGARSCLDGGTLSLYVAQGPTPWALLRFAARALFDRLEDASDIHVECVRELWLDAPWPWIRVGLDGEVVKLRPPLHYRVRPGALRVLVPAGAPVQVAAEEREEAEPAPLVEVVIERGRA